MPNRHYKIAYVFPPNYVFDEMRFAYERAAARIGNFTIHHNYYYWTPDKSEWNDPSLALVFLCNIPWVVPARRKARFIFHYVESVGDPKKMVPEQRKWLTYYTTRVSEPDLFIGGTPPVRDFWENLGAKAIACPIGYDPEIMGVPDWDREKKYDVGFCGLPVGRREWIIPAIARRFGNRFIHINRFGKARNDSFNFCKAMLYVGHAEEDAFADMRLWSAVSTSAALVTENRDAWPAVPGLHYVPLHHARREDPDAFVAALEAALRMPLLDTARRMNKDLAEYTVERCLRDFMIPAIEALNA